MTETRSISAPTAASDYRRQARRIRAVHRNNPAAAQNALKNLVAGRVPSVASLQVIDRTPSKFDWSSSAILGHRTPLARQFADQVAVELSGGILSYSSRQKLLAEAMQLRIERFEASLIIAAVQHRMKQPAFSIADETKPAKTMGFQIVTVLAIELLVVLAVAHLLM